MQIGDKVIYVGTTRDPCPDGFRYHKYPAIVTAVDRDIPDLIVDLRFFMQDRACGRMVEVGVRGVPIAEDPSKPPPRSFILPVKISR